MPFQLRQQLGLTPKTNMRLFKCESQPMKKSVLSNASIAPCSEESFVFPQTRPFDDKQSRYSKPNEFKMSQQPPKQLKGDNRASYHNMSTHSYDYRSSIGGESGPPDSSVVDNLLALSITIERRQKELELEAAKRHSESTNKEKSLHELNQSETSVKTIPEESEIVGKADTLSQQQQLS